MYFAWLRNCILLAMATVVVQACSSDDSTRGAAGSAGTAGPGGGSATGGAGGSSATGGANGGASGTVTPGSTGGAGGSGGGSGSTDGGSTSGDTPSRLPFLVDSLYVASGYMGDGAIAGAIAQDDNMACLAARAPNATGHCHKFTYTPQAMTSGGVGWGGVYWQYPVNNWGATPGKRIAAGATRVTFSAAGAAGGETVKFLVGGMTGTSYSDTLNISTTITLTNTMMPYIVDLTGQTYDAVLGGFGWVIEAPIGSLSPIAFTIDSITWDQ
jgi:hypothetical protein